MGDSIKNYSQFRAQYEDQKTFEWFFAQLSEEEAIRLIENEDTSRTAKICMFALWKKGHDRYEEIMAPYYRTDEEKGFLEKCDDHYDYDSIDDYICDIIRWLMLSPWNYTEEQAKERVEMEMRYIKKCFDKGETVSDAGVEVGYGCG